MIGESKEGFAKMPKVNWKARLGFTNVDILKTYTPPEVVKKYFPGGYLGFDKEGSPIMIDPLGRLDFKGLLRSAKGDDILRLRMWIAERGIQLCKEQSEQLQKEVKSTTIIADLEGLGLKHMWKPGLHVFNTMATMFQDDYPDLMKRTLVVNAPRVFPVLFALVKPFLGEETKRKIKVLGGNWKHELLKYIDADQLPVQYGGTLTDPDGDLMCRSHICYAGEVPKSFYAHTDTLEDEGLDFAAVRHGGQLKLEYNVEQIGSILHWYFRTEGFDIGFGVYHKQLDNKLEEVIALDKRESHLMAEDGSHVCTEKGIYVVKFDNSYSWTKSKRLHYQIGLTAAE